MAAWREALLAQAVLQGRTSGYRHHPQLVRFRELPDPAGGIGSYLQHLATEAARRGYRFKEDRISTRNGASLTVTDGQLLFEWQHLLRKLHVRDPARWAAQLEVEPRPHPLFTVVSGPIEGWERLSSSARR